MLGRAGPTRSWRRPALTARPQTLTGAIAMLAVVDDRLVLVTRRDRTGAGLPTFVPGPGDGLDDVARATAESAACGGPIYLEQLYTFAAAATDQPPSVVVSYLALLSGAERVGPDMVVAPVVDAAGALDRVERDVVDYAVVRLRAKIGYTTIAFHLMALEFTLSELQRTYQTILGVPLDKRNFRRRILATGLVSQTEGRRVGANHRPAALYQFAAEHDPSAFLTPAGASRVASSTSAG